MSTLSNISISVIVGSGRTLFSQPDSSSWASQGWARVKARTRPQGRISLGQCQEPKLASSRQHLLILSYLIYALTRLNQRKVHANRIWLARYLTSRDWAGWVRHSTHLMRSIHPIGLELLPGPRVRVGRVNPSVTLISINNYYLVFVF